MLRIAKVSDCGKSVSVLCLQVGGCEALAKCIVILGPSCPLNSVLTAVLNTLHDRDGYRGVTITTIFPR